MTRSQEREQAFILIFECGFNRDIPINELYEMAVESEFLNESDYTKRLAVATAENLEEIDGRISEFTVGWTLDRITKVSLSILRIAVCEMLYFDDVPVGVSINEAVELAKNYATKEDSQFINGVLGSIAKSIE
ncbi:MAG: transcription antitermination factor NusB [Clostridia bacterium]|nr:transcription antitermination factor NusB [Clostridia bacterium]MBR5015762.1 transcription antitermination factor NusB [Clostridia bacterium]MBR5977158.1 transcription antitermination factor NusB [Clostridia bacterium]MBR6512173.1 transcription antitermination factor NusB [Clostridia bacterium]